LAQKEKLCLFGFTIYLQQLTNESMSSVKNKLKTRLQTRNTPAECDEKQSYIEPPELHPEPRPPHASVQGDAPWPPLSFPPFASHALFKLHALFSPQAP
jgi:hypothetical protein